MPKYDKTSNLSVIAVRILPHCRDSVRKCLKENVYYYLNTNFEISEDGNTIALRERHLEAINDTFFNENEIFDDNESLMAGSDQEGRKRTPNISISAIVGKNGDGKSSLVEFMLRLINNFVCRRGLNPNEHLVYVDGVYGELYYRLNGNIYRIKISERNENFALCEFHEYSYDVNEKVYSIGDSITEFNPDETLFYTLVSNYSHFAYNTEDFKEESHSGIEEDLWLQSLFHKNDAYQTPINLHPYRDQGNIDINKEKLLSMQRLITSIVRDKIDGSNVKDSEFIINGKSPYALKLTDYGSSKLQEITLKSFFESHKNNEALNEEIRKRYTPSENRYGYAVNNEILIDATRSLEEMFYKYIRGGIKGFFRHGINWMGKNGFLESSGDLRKLLNRLSAYGKINSNGRYDKKPIYVYWYQFSRLSAINFLRLALVHDICKTIETCEFFNSYGKKFDPKIIFEDYDKLSAEDKCLHYIIYKIISIFESYPSYENEVKSYRNVGTFLNMGDLDLSNGTLFNLNRSWERLREDFEWKSHITLKLRQTVNLFSGRNEAKQMFDLSKYKSSGKIIVLADLNDDQRKILSDIETLPPPIIKCELMFRSGNSGDNIAFSAFSSGERQKIFFIAAIIYHLQNINSIGAERIHYHSVNLIFEEIELYFHPEWQRTLIFDLMKSIRSANIPEIRCVNMIFVTHSPYILSDIPKSNVLFLKNGAPTYEMQENTFGANINSLLKNGFFLPSLPMGEFAYRKINTLFKKLHSGEFDREEMDQIYAQIMTVGEPAIRMQLMTLFAPYRLFNRNKKELIEKLSELISDRKL